MLNLSTGPTIPDAHATRGVVYLPSVHVAVPYAPTGDELSVVEQLFLLFSLHPHQQRKDMHWHPQLAMVAHIRCVEMAELDHYGHVDPYGFGPNYDVRRAGYRLNKNYSTANDSNELESINAGYKQRGKQYLPLSPAEIWRAWLDSEGHRPHVLGLHDWYKGQTNVGIGYYALADSKYKYYYSLITCHPED